MKGFLDFVQFIISDFVSVSLASFKKRKDLVVADSSELALEIVDKGGDVSSDFLLQIAIMSLARPGRNNVLQRNVVDEGVNLEEVANTGLIKHIVLNLADAVGSSGHDFLLDLVRGVGEHDFTILRSGGFAHFLLGILEIADTETVVELHELNLGFRLDRESEDVAEFLIKLLGDTASELDMLELVFADGDVFGVVEENVSGHEDGIVKNANIDAFLPFAFVLVLSHAAEVAHAGNAVKNPTEFGMSGDAGLAVDVDIIIKIQAGGEVIFQGTSDIRREIAVDVGDDRMKIGGEDIDTVIGAMSIREADHRNHGAEEVAEGEFAVDANASENSFHSIIITLISGKCEIDT